MHKIDIFCPFLVLKIVLFLFFKQKLSCGALLVKQKYSSKQSDMHEHCFLNEWLQCTAIYELLMNIFKHAKKYCIFLLCNIRLLVSTDHAWTINATHSAKVAKARRVRTWRWEDDLLWARMKIFRTSFYVPAPELKSNRRCNVFSTSATNKDVRLL